MAYLKKSYTKASGRTYLSMAQGYRDKERGHTRTKIVESFGYLDELAKKHDDPIAHFQKVVDDYNKAEEQEASEYVITAKKNQKLEKNTSGRKNYGYIVIMKIIYELGLDRFLINRRVRNTKIEFNTSAIMKMLLISRILTPGSKKRAHDKMGRYFDFEKEDMFSLEEVYRALSHFAGLSKDIQLLIHDRITKNYGRGMDLVYYDVTNYYFEIDKEDELRKKGYSKENRKSPIVQMGLAMDAEGLPISYDLFPGNESEKLYLRPMVLELHNRFDSGRIIAVADSAQNTGNNVYYLDNSKQCYVFSQSIRGGSEDFQKYVVDDAGYEWHGKEYKRKSRVERRKIQVDFERKDGTTHKKTVQIDQRQIVFYSEKYAARSRVKREAAIKKAEKIISNPSAYTKATSHGALRYVLNVEVDDKTGEIRESKGTPCFNLDKIREDEKYDGYYAIVTNIFEEGENLGKFSDDKIIDIYRGLWQIEDSFRVTKSELETRPVYLSREDRIQAHFLTCFIALVIIRLIQKRTGHKYAPEVLIETMNNISCSHEGQNLFLFDYRSDTSDDRGNAFGIDFTRQRLTRKEIKKNLGDAKIS
jgi:transposase